MSSQIRTFTQLQNDLQTYILRQNQKIDTSSGQILTDISLDATAYQMSILYAALQNVITSQSILNAQVMSTVFERSNSHTPDLFVYLIMQSHEHGEFVIPVQHQL